MTKELSRSLGRVRFGAALLAALLLAGLLPGTVFAAATVTSATGGSAISADTAAASPGSGAYTTLTGPSIAVTAADDIDAGTITITAPAGFEFATSGTDPSIGVGATGATASFTSATTSVVTFTVTVANTAAGTATISGLRVRPTVGTSLATGQLAIGGGASVSDATAGTLTEVAGAPILVFQTQPSSTATAGTAFAAQPVVTSMDKFDNPRDADSVTLSIKSGTGASGAALTCTANPKATNASGVATFAGCEIDKSSGTPYVLRAATSGAVTIESTSITVSPGAPTQIGFATQPARGTAGGDFASQPVVAIQDAEGNTVTTAPATNVTLALTTDPPGGSTLTCSGGLVKGTSSGLATFNGCELNKVGVGYIITASAPGFSSVPSSLFDVSDRLVFTTQPAGAVGGIAFTTQPVVAVRAGASTASTHDQGSQVLLSITGAPAGVTLTCTTNPVTAVNGVATFAGCRIDKTGTYTLTATSSGLTSAASSSFAVVAGSASKVGFTAQPAAGVVTQAFPIQPVVAIQDAGGNTVTTGASSTLTVTLSIGTNPGGGTLTCTGGLSKAAVAGIATFSGCAIDRSGNGYTLLAAASGLTSATSTVFNVAVVAASITLTTSASVIIWGSGIVLTTQFGTSGANRTFQLQRLRAGVDWTTIATLTTDASGRSIFAYRPATNNWYRAVFAGAADLSAGISNAPRTVVRQIALLRPTNGGAIKSIARNASITFTITDRPARAELTPATVRFVFYRLVGSKWTLVDSRDLVVDAAGLAKTTYTFSTSGSWYVRARANPTPYNANSFWSPVERYSVR